MKKFRQKMAEKAGFTLVELIVVIAILGILAGVAVPAYTGYIEKAHEAADYTQLDAIKTAVIFAATDANLPDSTDVTSITVTPGTGVKYSGTAGDTTITNEPIDISEYCDVPTAFESGATSATWKAADQEWTLTSATPEEPEESGS